MFRLIIMIMGTVLAFLFCVQLLRGRKYDKYIRNLDGMEFPLKDLFTVGFAWSSIPVFKLKGNRKKSLVHMAELIYGKRYVEYYANVTWAQTLTYIHLGLALTCLISALNTNQLYAFGMGMFVTVAMVSYGFTAMKNKVTERRESCEAELANAVSTMAILLNSGMILRDVWGMVSRGDGPLYELMRLANQEMKDGMSEVEAIHMFGRRSDSPEIKKFSSNMIQSIENGGPELIRFMEMQSRELWEEKKQTLLRQGELAATKLLLPIMLIFIGILIIIMTAAFAGALF